ncbi:MAG: hypothetical protein IJA07_01825 [Agathobacter sp.]|nr:hypothetical protein [Agathobacter sp.]
MDKQIYDNYRQSRNTNIVSALDSYMANRKSMIENYEESHKRLLENMDEARRIEKELAERILKLLDMSLE